MNTRRVESRQKDCWRMMTSFETPSEIVAQLFNIKVPSRVYPRQLNVVELVDVYNKD
jgi:hypothetical protein